MAADPSGEAGTDQPQEAAAGNMAGGLFVTLTRTTGDRLSASSRSPRRSGPPRRMPDGLNSPATDPAALTRPAVERARAARTARVSRLPQ
jgi:hypothetical protein